MARQIFRRILGLLGLLIAATVFVMSVYVLSLCRQEEERAHTVQGYIMARQLAPLLMWGDRVAARKALSDAISHDDVLRYAFVVRNGTTYVHTFSSGFPQDLLALQRGRVGEETIRVIRDQQGTVLYDLAISIEATDGILHLGLDRDKIDRSTLPLLLSIALGGLVFLLLAVYPSRAVAAAIAREITEITAQLNATNEMLEARVAERTAQLSDSNERLCEERERLAVTLRSIGDGVIATDVKGRITLLNRVAETLTGWKQEEAIRRPLAEIFHVVDPRTREPIESPVDRVLRTQRIAWLEKRTVLLARDGRERVIADSGAPICDAASQIVGVVVVFRDVTEKERMELELQRAEKLESLGILAGGIAHDFNNLLTTIMGNLSLARLDVQPASQLDVMLESAEMASSRSKELAFKLLTFAKGTAPARKACRIEVLVRDAARLALSGAKSQCRFVFPPALPSVMVDLGQINQVVHNLLLNAEQAMANGGEITVRAEAVTVEANESRPVAAGPYVRVTVEDQGCGIAQSDLNRILDPYFTTKEHGSGLGLAVVHSIIQSHQGHLEISSEVGKGASISFYLPACEQNAAAEEQSLPLVDAKRGRILVMDDESDVREVICSMLNRFGHETKSAACAEEAIEKCVKASEHRTPFDLVILDLTIRGGAGGVETLRRLRQRGISAPAIASSGYSSDPVMADPAAYGFTSAIAKPCDIIELQEVTQKTLSSQPEATRR